MKIIVLASGSGTNFLNLAKNFKIDTLISNKESALCLEHANNLKIENCVIKENNQLFEKLKKLNPDLICLAGYMKIIPKDIVDFFSNKIINLHPSLLPKYKGLNAFERSYKEDDVLGVTIHFVDSGLDTGRIIKQSSFKKCANYQECVKLLKIHEHKLYTDVVKKLIEEYDEKKSIN